MHNYKPSKLSATAKLKINIFVGFLCNVSNFITAVKVKRFPRKQRTYKATCVKSKLYWKYWNVVHLDSVEFPMPKIQHMRHFA